MPTMTLRDVPEGLHAWLKQQARMHHRSVNKEVIALLEHLRVEAPGMQRRATVEDLLAIGARVARSPVLDDRDPDTIIGLD